ncbi:hypothetical protein B0H17DRAFT_1199710 [Mycena rosella]|uniref:Uncharacterized protein n=1 Tax=Mycena rosella TaxID=1033263 RepID=A0AAD7GGB9_MYCRO|nr:hypothetical protein B0H17DRAFT_1199710 [Mycena rosella]
MAPPCICEDLQIDEDGDYLMPGVGDTLFEDQRALFSRIWMAFRDFLQFQESIFALGTTHEYPIPIPRERFDFRAMYKALLRVLYAMSFQRTRRAQEDDTMQID